jgi:hypothetical protein
MISLVLFSLGLVAVVGLGSRGYGDDTRKTWTKDDFVFSSDQGPPAPMDDYACKDMKGDPSCFPINSCQTIDPGFVIPGDPNSVIRVSAKLSGINTYKLGTLHRRLSRCDLPATTGGSLCRGGLLWPRELYGLSIQKRHLYGELLLFRLRSVGSPRDRLLISRPLARVILN